MKNQIVKTRNFVVRHRTGIAVALTAAMAVKWQMNTVGQFNEFLKEHELFDEFYATIEE